MFRSWRRAQVLGLRYLIAASVAGSGCPLAQAAPSAEQSVRSGNVELRWQAPERCSSPDQVSLEIERLLSSSALQGPISARIVIAQRKDRRYRLELSLLSPVTGERVLTHNDCAVVARAAALIVAMAIDPDAVQRARSQASNSSGTGSAAAQQEPAAAAPVANGRERERAAPGTQAERAPGTSNSEPAGQRRDPDRTDTDGASTIELAIPDFDETAPRRAHSGWPNGFEFLVAAGGYAERGVSPALSPGLFVGIGVMGDYWRAALQGAWLPHSQMSTVAGAQLTFQTGWVDAQACAGLLRRTFGAGLCGFVRQQWVAATAQRVDESLSPVTALTALGAGPLVTLRLSRGLHVEAALDVAWPLQRPRFVIENAAPPVVFRPASWSRAVRVGATVSF